MTTSKQKIERLRNEIKQIEANEAAKGIETFQYLVGKYFHRAATSWEKVIAIDRVDEEGEITYDCISIYYDEKDERTKDCSINNRSWGSIDEEDIKRYEITKERFEGIYVKAVTRITNEL